MIMWPKKKSRSSIAKPTCQISAVLRPKIAAIGGCSGECRQSAKPVAAISGPISSSTTV
jgi:hypothetical protein